MSETRNVILAILVVNLLAFGGIIYETGYFEDRELDTSTIVTANLIIKFKNLGDNDTKIFEDLTTSEATAYGLLIAASENSYSVGATTDSVYGLYINSIDGWGDCNGCQSEDGYFWLYSVNNESGDIAANRKVINDNDIIEWHYTDEY